MIIDNKDINFAVVGVGHIGKRHIEMILKHSEACLIAVCDIDQTLNGLYPVPFYTNMAEMLAKHPEIQAVCICTPNNLHSEQSLLALKSRKHIICEKPMALSRAECEKIIFESLHVSRQVFCVMQNRYSPPSQWLKQIGTDGLLGDIFMVQICCFWNRDDRYYFPNNQPHQWKGRLKTDGGTLFTQFSHFIDIMYWLFGDIQNIQSQFFNFNHSHSIEFEDSGNVNFQFCNGGAGSLQYSTSVYGQNLESSLTVVGSKGSVKVGGQYMNEIELCNIKDYELPMLPPSNPANDYGSYKGSAANHVYLIENVIDVLKNRKTITTNALEGMKVVEIIEKIYAAGQRF